MDDVELAYSGFEARTGELGNQLNDLRTELLQKVLLELQNFTASSVENAVRRAIPGAASKFNARNIAAGGAHFLLNLDRLRFQGSMRLSGIGGDASRLGGFIL